MGPSTGPVIISTSGAGAAPGVVQQLQTEVGSLQDQVNQQQQEISALQAQNGGSASIDEGTF